MEFLIEHRGPQFRLSRTWTAGGASDTFSLALTIGAEPEPVPHQDTVIYPALHWDGEDLVFPTRIVRGESVATNLVRYRLADGGATLVADEQLRSDSLNYANHWVLRREAPQVEGERQECSTVPTWP